MAVEIIDKPVYFGNEECLKEFFQTINEEFNEQKPLEKEFAEIIDEKFWELL